MNIKILDSWLREHIKTKATPEKIAEVLSLTSVSVERIEKVDNDFVYDIEVTTNRPDVMSVTGVAREAAAALSQFGIEAQFIDYKPKNENKKIADGLPITIKNNDKLVGRICAVVLKVNLNDSPDFIKKRLEASGIRSLNNIIDVTNYVMREIGHPTHVFDYDRLTNHTLIIREAKKGEKVTTLDKKTHTLMGGDIVADNGKGEIVDLLGIMGTANSVVTNDTKTILFFIDNNEATHIRKTSMSLSIRTEAAVLNEKGVDPELAMTALNYGIELFKKVADGIIASSIIDIYPKTVKTKTITVSKEKIDSVLGISIPLQIDVQILASLGFITIIKNNTITVKIPSWRANDVQIEEDIIEEIARIYGYSKLSITLPPVSYVEHYNLEKNNFYWENRVKNALKYWGFTEVYTYSLVSEELLEGPTTDAVTLANPLTEDMTYLRRTIVPSLLQVMHENKNFTDIKIFEIANVYHKTNENNLPLEIQMLSVLIKKEKISFYEAKGVLEQLLSDLGIKKLIFKKNNDGGNKANIFIDNDCIGDIEILQDNIIDFEINFEKVLNYVTSKKTYTPISKYPPLMEDVTLTINDTVSFEKIVNTIKQQSVLVEDVCLIDVFKNKKTFRITYRDSNENLTSERVAKEREKIYKELEKSLNAKIG